MEDIHTVDTGHGIALYDDRDSMVEAIEKYNKYKKTEVSTIEDFEANTYKHTVRSWANGIMLYTKQTSGPTNETVIDTDMMAHIADAGYVPWGSRYSDGRLLSYFIESDALQQYISYTYYIVDVDGDIMLGNNGVQHFQNINKAIAVADSKIDSDIEQFPYLDIEKRGTTQ